MSIGPHRATDLANGYGPAGPGEPFVIPGQLKGPRSELQAEGGRLRPDAVGTSQHGRGAMLQCFPLDNFEESFGSAEQQSGRFVEQHALRSIEDIGRGEPVMDPFAARGRVLGEQIDECRQIMVGYLFARSPGDGIDRVGAPDRGGRLRGSHPEFAPSLDDQSFDFLPDRQLAFFGPDGRHVRKRVTRDHGKKLSVISRQLSVSPGR